MINDLASVSPHASTQLVPAGYAEKAMASLMQLHSELMDEKERRVDLFRKLMEREQALAELKMYVKVLEEKLTPPAPIVTSPPPAVATQPPPLNLKPPTPPSPRQTPPVPPPMPPRVTTRARLDGWKTW